MHWKPLPLLFSLSAILLLFAFVTRTPAKTEFESAKQIIVMRKIANEILRYTGDSSSAILPVERLSPLHSGFLSQPVSGLCQIHW